MTTTEELHSLIDAIPDDARDEARVLLVGLLRREGDSLQGADPQLDAVAADPIAKARMNELIRVGLEQADRGELLDGEDVFSELLGER